MSKEETEKKKNEILEGIKRLKEKAPAAEKAKLLPSEALKRLELQKLTLKVFFILAVIFLLVIFGPGLFKKITGTEAPDFVKSIGVRLGVTAEETGVEKKAESIWSRIRKMITKPEEYATGIADWKVNPIMKEEELEKKQGVTFVSSVSKKTAYKEGEELETISELIVYGPTDRASTSVKFNCKLDNEKGIAEPASETVYMDEEKRVHVNCRFKPKQLKANEKVLSKTAVLEAIYENYQLRTNWGVYTMKSDLLNEKREAGEDPFEGVTSESLTKDRLTKSEVEDGPVVLILGTRDSQPLVNDRYYELGVSLEENDMWAGSVKEVKDLRIMMPDVVQVQKECSNIFEKVEGAKKITKLTSYNEYELYGIAKGDLNAYLSAGKKLSDFEAYWCRFSLDKGSLGELTYYMVNSQITVNYAFSKKAVIDIGEKGYSDIGSIT